MEIAILLFDRLTALDAVGPYEVLSRIPGATVKFVAKELGPKRTDVGSLALVADYALDQVPSPDIVVVPGGPGQMALMDDEPVLNWVRQAHETSKWTTSVCTGSLILGAAGLLRGLKATSHWLAYDALRSLGAEAVSDRVVIEGKIITAAGVSAGIDMALTLVARECGDDLAQAIQLGIEYDPQPPFDAGSLEKAPAHIVERLKSSSRFIRNVALSDMDPTIRRLLSAVPDQPKWVELRAMLLSGQCEVYGLEGAERLSFVARHAEMEMGAICGRPAPDLIRRVIALPPSLETVLCLPEDRRYVAEALPEWRSEIATIYRLATGERLPEVPADAVRLLSPSEIEAMNHAPAELKEELIEAATQSPVAATCVGKLPVSFCYAGSRTESLWDISIDTLAGYRNLGYAALCVSFLIEYFRRRGLAPVWGALESNIPSMRLAAKLGFTPVDQIVVFEQSDQATVV